MNGDAFSGCLATPINNPGVYFATIIIFVHLSVNNQCGQQTSINVADVREISLNIFLFNNTNTCFTRL